MKKIAISILIPVFMETSLDNCVDSLLNQTLKNKEIILIDFGVSSDLKKKLLNYEKRFTEIRVLSKKSEDKLLLYNYGILEAKGEYVFFLNSYDYLEKHALESYYSNVKENNSDVLLYVFNENGTNLYNGEYSQKEIISDINENLNNLLFNYHYDIWTKMYKKTFLIENDIVFSEQSFINDHIFHFKSLINARTITYISDIFYYHDSNILSNRLFNLNYNTYSHNFNNIKQLFFDKRLYKSNEISLVNYILEESLNSFKYCSNDDSFELFDILKDYFLEQNYSEDLLKKIKFSLYKFYIHILISNSYVEFKLINQNTKNKENVLSEQLHQKNVVVQNPVDIFLK